MPRSVDRRAEPVFRPVLIDLPWPAEGNKPADPDLVDEILEELGIVPAPEEDE